VSGEQLRRTLLAEAEERLLRDQALMRDEPDGPQAQVVAYSAFGDALDAAGLARALGDEQRMRDRLADAANAGVRVFELVGTHRSSVTTLEEGVEETFVDTSATNPWTLLRALYAALAADEGQAVERLAAIDPAGLPGDQVIVSPQVLDVAQALRDVVRGDAPAAAVCNDAYWDVQLDVLGRLASGDRDGLADALERVGQVSDGYWRSAGEGDMPEALLRLPELGLRALAAGR
jgi:hypothetical protein